MIEQAEIKAQEETEKARMAQTLTIAQTRIKGEEDIRRREIARQQGLEEADIAAREAVESAEALSGHVATIEEILGLIRDIASHTMPAIRAAEKLGAWEALPEADIFDIEGIRFKVSSIPHLIKAKRSIEPKRRQDIYDIQVLEELNHAAKKKKGD